MKMIDHVGLDVSDYEVSKRFYELALSPLGYELLMEFPQIAGFGRDGKPEFWIATRGPSQTGVHVAFASSDREGVDRFHEAALAAGGRSNGEPGVRPLYHEHYYGAYVLDPDGNNVEAVCHAVP
jgi:catechol 2,3-dioxygenase-like lactoylglutathione lyase family enzyme